MASNSDGDYESEFVSDEDSASEFSDGDDEVVGNIQQKDVEVYVPLEIQPPTAEQECASDNSDTLVELDPQSTSPEVQLAHFRQTNLSNLSCKNALLISIKILALTKIIYGPSHWRVAEAHIDLAEAYEKGKKFALQTLKHTGIARDMLLSSRQELSFHVEEDGKEKDKNLPFLLQKMYLLMGKANCHIKKFRVAENCLRKAQLVSDKAAALSLKSSLLRIDIFSTMCCALCKLGKLGEGVSYLEEAIEIADGLSSDSTLILVNLLVQLGNTELLNGKHANFSIIIDSYQRALDTATEIYGESSVNIADILSMLAKAKVKSGQSSGYEDAEPLIKRSIDIYKSSESYLDKCLTSQHLLAKIYLEQQKYADAKLLIDEAVKKCEDLYGDTSIQAAEFYEIYGSLLFAQKKSNAAVSYFMKAEEIYRGKNKCKPKRDKLGKLIEMISRTSKSDKLKTSDAKLKERPRFNGSSSIVRPVGYNRPSAD